MTDQLPEIATPTAEPPASSAAEHRMFLHIGTFKTGTSFLQSVLLRNRKRLARDGVCYPTDHTNWGLQTRATRDMLGAEGPDGTEGAWLRMVAEIRDSPAKTAVISVERLSMATTDNVRAFKETLAPSDVHAIVTLRDLARVFPSDWQSKVKQGRTWPFDTYVQAARATSGPSNAFWRHHDAPRIVREWLGALAPDHLHVVTVPPPGAPPALLWERFCAVLGIDPSRYDTSQDAKSNFSLSYTDTEFLRQINASVGRGIDKKERKHFMTRYLANTVLRPDSSEAARQDRPTLGSADYAWVREQAVQIVDDLRSLDVDVTGDLTDLIPAEQVHDVEPSTPATVVPDRAADIVAALLRRLAEVHSASAEAGTTANKAARKAAKRARRAAQGADGAAAALAAGAAERDVTRRDRRAKRKKRKQAASGDAGAKATSGRSGRRRGRVADSADG